MHQVSDLYKQILRLPHRVENKLEIYGQVYTRAHIISLDTTRQIFKEEVPSVGNTPAGMITVSMLTPPEEIPIQEKMLLSSRIVSGDLKSEWVPKGTFYIDTRHPAQLSTGENVEIELVGYDRMLMAEKDYSPTGQWPRMDADVLAELCQLIGVECDEVLDKGYQISEPYEYTCRELLGFIGAMYGGNWVIDDFGKLRLLRLGSAGGASETVAQNLSVGTPLSPITRVVLHKMDGTSFTAGAAGRTLNVDCPWATQEMAEGILQQVQGYRYQPFSAEEAAIDPALELGDQVAEPGGAVIGTVYQLYTAHSDVLIADMAAPPEEEINHDFPARSTAGGTAGRAMNAARGLKKDSKELKEQTKRLVADVKKAQAGIEARVKYVDLEDGQWVNAHTSIFAQAGGKRAAFDLWVEGVSNGEIASGAKLVADTIELKAKTIELKAGTDNLMAGLNAIATEDERKRWKEAKTTMFAQIGKDKEALQAGIDARVTTKAFGEYQKAAAELYATDGKVKSIIGTYVVGKKNGSDMTLAAILADQIKLEGRVDLTGSLSVSGGNIHANGDIDALTGTIVANTIAASNEFLIGGNQYVPTQITSTTGAVMALGYT